MLLTGRKNKKAEKEGTQAQRNKQVSFKAVACLFLVLVDIAFNECLIA